MPESSKVTGSGVVRLVVASPDGRRVLARPNGLAGWALPAVPATLPARTWTAELAARAEATLGSAVEPVQPLGPDAWAVTTTGRITAAGNTWIAIDEAGRLGADEAVVRRWAESGPAPRGDGDRG